MGHSGNLKSYSSFELEGFSGKTSKIGLVASRVLDGITGRAKA
jgi:hypothetical protein